MQLKLGPLLLIFGIFAIIAAVFTQHGAVVEPGAETTGPALPASFEVQEIGGWNTNMDVVAGGQKLATIDEKPNGRYTTFEYRDSSNKLIASAQLDKGQWVDTIDVWTNSGRKIGTIKEEWSQRGWASTVYSIMDGQGKEIASSTKTKAFFSATKFQLTDNAGTPLVTIERTGFWPRDVWTVTQERLDSVDARVLVMIGAFKTAHDNNSDD